MNPITITVTGRLGDDPRTFTTRDGTDGVELRLALDLPARGSGDGITRWVKVTAFGLLATRTAESVRKGDRVTVLADDLMAEAWTATGSGEPRARVTLRAREIAASMAFDSPAHRLRRPQGRPRRPPPTASRPTFRPVSRPRSGSCAASPPPDPPSGRGGPSARPASVFPAHCLVTEGTSDEHHSRPAAGPDQFPDRPAGRHPAPARLHPHDSLVVVGVGQSAGRVQVAFRYDLPDPPDAGAATAIAAHAAGVLARQQVTIAVAVGYGPGRLVTPVADASARPSPAPASSCATSCASTTAATGRTCAVSLSCCPADGVPFDAASHPAAELLAEHRASRCCPAGPRWPPRSPR